MVPDLTILRTYAKNKDPNKMPNAIRLTFTDNTLTVFDAFPKAIFHLLVLPRLIPPLTLTAAQLTNLHTLLNSDRELALGVLTNLAKDADKVKLLIEKEMVERYGFKWAIWTGFHAAPSMEHLHLHVISSDLCAPALKKKRHYNSFHPTLGFFLSLDEVLSWFSNPDELAAEAAVRPSQYEMFLKDPLVCWYCDDELPNMPKLKAHLQAEWDKVKKARKPKPKPKPELKRPRADGDGDGDGDGAVPGPSKRRETRAESEEAEAKAKTP